MNFVNSNKPLTTQELRSIAPSVFASHASPKVSDRYQFVDTASVVAKLQDSGYVAMHAGQGRTRRPDGGVYTKHVVRLMHERYLDGRQRKVGDVVPQAIITNSHDRTSALHIGGGLFRLVCSNGMAVDAGTFTSVRVLHNDPNIHELVMEGLGAIEEATEAVVLPKIEKMLALELSPSQTINFARAATVLKHGKVLPAEAELLLNIRREADATRNMWAVMNRIQENAVKGGYQTVDAAGRTRTAAGITSPTRDLDFNVRLWTLAARATEDLAG